MIIAYNGPIGCGKGVQECFSKFNLAAPSWSAVGNTVSIVGPDINGNDEYKGLLGQVLCKYISPANSPLLDVELKSGEIITLPLSSLSPPIPFNDSDLITGNSITTIPNKNTTTRPFDGAIVEEVSGIEAEVYVDFSNINIRDTI